MCYLIIFFYFFIRSAPVFYQIDSDNEEDGMSHDGEDTEDDSETTNSSSDGNIYSRLSEFIYDKNSLSGELLHKMCMSKMEANNADILCVVLKNDEEAAPIAMPEKTTLDSNGIFDDSNAFKHLCRQNDLTFCSAKNVAFSTAVLSVLIHKENEFINCFEN